MPPAAATENRVRDTLLSVLGGVGVPPSSWLTVPETMDGVPGSKLPAPNKPRYYVQFVSTTPKAGDRGTKYHRMTVSFAVWIAAKTQAEAISAKADLLRAIFGAEATFTNAYGSPMYPGETNFRLDMSRAGIMVIEQALHLDTVFDHAAP